MNFAKRYVTSITDGFKPIYNSVLFLASKIVDVISESGAYQSYEVPKMSWEEIMALRAIARNKFSRSDIDEFRNKRNFSEIDKELNKIRNDTRTYAVTNRSSGLTVRINNINRKKEDDFVKYPYYFDMLSPKVEDDKIILYLLSYDPKLSVSKENIETVPLINFFNMMGEIMDTLIQLKFGERFTLYKLLNGQLQPSTVPATTVLAMHISMIYELNRDRSIFNNKGSNINNIGLYLYDDIVMYNADMEYLINKFLDLGCRNGYVDPEKDDSGFGEMCKLMQDFVCMY